MPTYDRFPCLTVPGSEGSAVAGWPAVAGLLRDKILSQGATKTVVVMECYPGIDTEEIAREVTAGLAPALLIRSDEALADVATVESLVQPFLGDGDPVFGKMNNLHLPDFFAAEKMAGFQSDLAQVHYGVVVIIGVGARLFHRGDILVYVDLARWEAQLRFRRRETGNLGACNLSASPAEKYKRAYFVDWRVADRWKQPMMREWNFVLDTHLPGAPRMVDGQSFRHALAHVTTRPFRVVPFFDPAPWGGQWLREHFGLGAAAPNFGWGFDCVPEENSLLLEFGGVRMEFPSLDLVLYTPAALLGDKVRSCFGDEFPIRFDLLDTMGGGNLSLQVHPLASYVKEHFNLPYTQDESYYILAAGAGAEVYLGLRQGADPAFMGAALQAAQAGGAPFAAETFAARWPARKHDHFLIPAGTLHCSGAEIVVLEISATPYIFTFKLWDWDRLGLDGKPRPIHLERGLANLRPERDAAWAEKNLINQIIPLQTGPGWRSERTGLHPLEPIETVRHWFTSPVPHHTGGTVQVLNLVEGDSAVVESPTGKFAPFTVNFAETFIVPAAVGEYTVSPRAKNPPLHATLRASISPLWPLS